MTRRAEAVRMRLKRSWLACSSPVVTHGRMCFKCLLINIHVSSSIHQTHFTPPPTCSPTSCCLMCPKLFLNLHNLDWSAFQMAFPVLTLSGNKGETHLLIRLSLCVGWRVVCLCVCVTVQTEMVCKGKRDKAKKKKSHRGSACDCNKLKE